MAGNAARQPSARSAKSRADKRRHILEAAVEVFARAGFHKSRVSDVAKEASVADGTIYLYFKSKDEILLSIFEEAMAEMIEAVEAQLAPLSDPFEQLRTFAAFHMSRVEKHKSVAKVLQVELRLSNTFMREYKPTKLKQYLDIVGRIVRLGQSQGVMRDDVNPIIIRRALFGALDEIAMQWILTPAARYGLKESASQIADVFAAGLRKPDA
ncbi:MAG: TetR/AcrR family transcriptional regulator [Deltaproteobacteria bacterium]|nr:TetR/AcrR family transcriptional regulator [Deltaproteobacteria bacterium]